MVFNATFNNISFILRWSVLLVEETGVNSYWQVSEWLLFNIKWAIFQLYQVKFQWEDDEVLFVLDKLAEFDFDSAS
jgi:hypothetical protein